MPISQNIKKFRRLAKLSQPELAKACGWESQSRISMYETGKREPGISDLKLIAAALNIELNQLFNEKENLLKQDFANYEIAAVFDDLPAVIEMFRNKGLNVIDVGPKAAP